MVLAFGLLLSNLLTNLSRSGDIATELWTTPIPSTCKSTLDIIKSIEEGDQTKSVLTMFNGVGRNRQRNRKSDVDLKGVCRNIIGLDTFDRYASRSCNSSSGEWADPHAAEQKCKYDRVGHLLGLRPGLKVFDWGAGCGAALNYLGETFAVSTFGNDILKSYVEYAERLPGVTSFYHSGDVDTMSCFPSDSFDVITTNGAMLHLTDADQCKLIKQYFIPMLTPGGCVWAGYNNFNLEGEHVTDMNLFKACLADLSGKVEIWIVNEEKLFGTTEYHSPTAESMFVCKHRK